MRSLLLRLMMCWLWTNSAFAGNEFLRIEPASPTTNDDVRIVFGGQLQGIPTIVERVDVLRQSNTIVLTVSRRAIPDPVFVSAYEGNIVLGNLALGRYTVNFFTRNWNGQPPPNDYNPPVFATSANFVVGTPAVGLPIGNLWLIVVITVLAISGVVHARHH